MSSWLLRLMDTIQNQWFEFSLPPNQHVDFLSVMYATPSRKEDPETEALVREAFLDDFRSRVWITYRNNFSPLIDRYGNEVGITSDAGWGCSIRATQMLVAQSLISLRFGREWRRRLPEEESETYRSIIAFFQDKTDSFLSVHRIVALGHERFGKVPSEWFGPTTSARAVQELINRESDSLRLVSVVFDCGEIYSNQVLDLFAEKRNGVDGILVLVSHRLGLDSFNLARYKGTIQSLFSCPFFQGLSSGEAMVSAYYFFAACDDFLFYLDPHTVQEAFLDTSSIGNVFEAFPPQPKPLRMRWSRLNPSLTMGFLVKSPKEWTKLAEYLLKIDPELFDVNEKPRETLNRSFSDLAHSDESDSEIVFVK